MSNDCVFCRIVAGELPAEVIYRDDQVLAFRDVRPQASSHLLVIPVEHLTSLNEATPENQALMGHLLVVAAKVARREGIDRSGYRVLTNIGPDGGQTVFHLHFHVLGGNRLQMRLG